MLHLSYEISFYRNFLFTLSLSNVSLIQVTSACPTVCVSNIDCLAPERCAKYEFICVPQATEWAPDEDTKRSCQSKGKSEVCVVCLLIQKSLFRICPFVLMTLIGVCFSAGGVSELRPGFVDQRDDALHLRH